MDAVQAVQAAPAVQIAAGTPAPVPAGAGAGEATPPHLFRSMFDEAATVAASRGIPAQGPADQPQVVRQRGVPVHFVRGAETRRNAGGAEGLEAEIPASRVQDNVVAAPVVGNAVTRHPADPGTPPAVTGEERGDVANGEPLWVMPEQLLMANRQQPAPMETAVTAGPAGSERPAAAALTRVTRSLAEQGLTVLAGDAPNGKEMQAAGEPPHGVEAMKLNEPAGSRQAEVDYSRDVQRGVGPEEAPRASHAESRSAGRVVVAPKWPDVAAEVVVPGKMDGPSNRVSVAGDKSPVGLTTPVPSLSSEEGNGGYVTMKMMHSDGVAKKATGDRDDLLRRHEPELKVQVKGETVLRQVPGGVTVSNPAQTTGMGGVSQRDDLPAEALRPEQPVRTASPVAGERAEQGADVVAADTAGSLKESFSSWGGSQQRPDFGTGEGSQPYPGHHVGPGNGEASVRGIEETLATKVSGEDRERLHQEILSQVRERLESHGQGNGDGRMTLRLNPRELGELQLNVRMDDRRMSVEVTAQNPVVKEALLQNLEQLKDTLSRQNIHMERFEVATGTGQQGAGQPFREGRQGTYRQADDIPYSPAGYFREESAAIPVAGWEARENSLVDVRL